MSNPIPAQVEPKQSTEPASKYWLRVALDVPLDDLFDYYHDAAVVIGSRVLVHFGRRQMVGVVVETPAQPVFEAKHVKAIDMLLDDTAPLSAASLQMAHFAASYYQRPLGEVLLPVLPLSLRKPAAYTGKRAAGGPVARLRKRRKAAAKTAVADPEIIVLNAEQQAAVQHIHAVDGHQTVLLHGITGSGKTEVYLAAALKVLEQGKQVLFMVPEINLTPQFEQALRRRLQKDGEAYPVAVLHSGLSEGERLRSWLSLEQGEARVLLGTRLSILPP